MIKVLHKLMILFIALLMASSGYAQNDKITFTWKGEDIKKFFNIHATAGKTVSIDWGNGSKDKQISDELNIIAFFPPVYDNSEKEYTVTISADSKDCLITYLHTGQNKMTSLDVSQAQNLTRLHCYEAEEIAELDLSKNNALLTLSCYSNKLNKLDLKSLENLTNLNFSDNQIADIDLNVNTNLKQLRCYSNQLTNLNISNSVNLHTLVCHTNNLSELDVTNLPELNSLYCHNNQLRNLNLSRNEALANLHCYNNNIFDLNLNKNAKLQSLLCYNNSLGLSELYNISQKADFHNLGTQILATTDIETSTEIDLSMNSQIGAKTTIFTIKKDGNTAVEKEDYTQNNNVFLFFKAGEYTIEMTNEALSYNTKVIAPYTVNNSSYIADEKLVGLYIYPNYATDCLFITSSAAIDKVQIYDMRGKSVVNTYYKDAEIDISNLSKGIYVIKTSNQSDTYTKRFIKE